jgi:hypothetical protein
MRAGGLARDAGPDACRQSLALVALTWVPLVALAIAQRLATGRWDEVVVDVGVHARLLVTVPLLLVAEEAMHGLSQRCIDRFVQNDFAPGGLGGVRRVATRGARLRDSWLAEAGLAVAALAVGQAALWGRTSPLGFVASHHATGGPSFAQLWWSIVALPIAQFLVFRSLWRWAAWAVVLWGLASLDVRPVALHPDRRGGLGFLAEPALGFAIVVLAMDSSVAGAWGEQMIFDRSPLQSHAVPLAGIAVACLIVTLGPLFVFTRCLWRSRFAAIREYDRLALTYARSFHRKWIEGGDTEGLLGSSDIQSMADLANSLAIVRGMRIVPFGLYEVTVLAVAIGLPVVPLLLAAVPLHELLRRLLGVFAAALA